MIHLKTLNKNWQKLLLLVAIPLFSVIGIIAAGVDVSAADDEAFDSATNGAAKDAVNTSGEEVHYFNVQVGTSVYTRTCQPDLLHPDSLDYTCEDSTPTKEVSTIRLTQQGGKYYISRVSNPNDGAGATLSKGTKVSVKGVKFAIVGNKLNISFDGGTQREIHVNLKKDMKKTRQDFRAKTSKTIKNLLCPDQPPVVSYNGSTMNNYCSYTFTPDSKVTTVKLTNADTNEDVDEDADSEVAVNCMNAGGSGTLGWIVCSITEWLGSAAENAYTEYVEPSLQVNPKLFEGTDDGTLKAWQTFRDIANTVFIILLIVVIFSQLTGVGIDNYGIKKILPKLIVAAILINLSYWICLVFIDLSNIIGNSFQAMFDGLGAGLGEPQVDLSGAGDASIGPITIKTSTIASVAVLGSLIATAGAIWANPAIVLSLLVSALGVVIAIFFLFILLAVREAVIVVLTVISPVAVVLYMLPNTKSIFDKWLKLFEGLLLVYPICGLLVGGGNYISRLLLSAGFAGGTGFSGFLKAFTAMIVGIVPIFFIPTVLKNSFQGLGNLGAKISGIGQKVSGATTGATRNSQAYKNAQDRFAQRETRLRAGVDKNGKPIEMGRFRRAMRGGSRNIARNRAQYRQDQLSLGAQNELLNNDVYGARLQADQEAQMMKGYQEQFANMDRGALEAEAASASSWLSQAGGEQRMAALIGAMETQGMQDNIYSMLRNNNVSGMSNVMKALAGSNDKILKAYGKRGFNTDYNSFMTGTGANSLQGYAAEKGADFVNGLDDKSLAEIKAQDDASVAAGNGHIMSTDQLIQAASQLNGEDSMREVNAMLSRRTDIAGKISGEQLVNMNDSTVGQLHSRGVLDGAIAAVRSDPQLASRMSANRRAQLGI